MLRCFPQYEETCGLHAAADVCCAQRHDTWKQGVYAILHNRGKRALREGAFTEFTAFTRLSAFASRTDESPRKHAQRNANTGKAASQCIAAGTAPLSAIHSWALWYEARYEEPSVFASAQCK